MSVCARHFSTEDIQTIQALIANSPGLKRTALSRTISQVLNWTKPNGELKDMSCRVALLRMQADGLIELPPSRSPPPQRHPRFLPAPATDAQAALQAPRHALPALRLQQVSAGTGSRQWNEHRPLPLPGIHALAGSQMRYNVFAGEQLVALISFGASA